ncbi:hypothetical protein EJB05_50195 [Eragrostis curvula]|uniref:PORR domain-containing protein n=1 Tax=Eragrostis curvula TaxID=38414 RepID=A0A5J9SYT5_9POAL|nr:hypothetical protein EJB05_50195 [Eragrostis curvula]
MPEFEVQLAASFFHTLDVWTWSDHMVAMSSSGGHGRGPKKKLYHREPGLDKAMDLQKKPALLLRLRELILAQKKGSLLSNIFHVSGGSASREPIAVTITEKAKRISSEEVQVRELMESILVRKLRKPLMMSMDCQIPLDKIELIQSEQGLLKNFKNYLIPSHSMRGELDFEGFQTGCGGIPKDGKFLGPFALNLKYPAGFRPNRKYLEEVVRWQKMAFPSPI